MPLISLVYSLNEIESKFKNIKTKRRNSFASFIIKETMEDFVKGIWGGEYLAKRRIKSEYLKGVVIDQSFMNMSITELFNDIKDNEINRQQTEFSEKRKKEIEDKNDVKINFKYHMSPEISKFELFVDELKEVLGDVKIKEVFKLVSKKLLIPIYEFNKEKQTCEPTKIED